MILALVLAVTGLVLSFHFASVKTIFGLFWRTGYQPPEDLVDAAARVERRWSDPAFFPAVSLGRTVGTFLLTLGLWLLCAPDLSREAPLPLFLKMVGVLAGVYALGQFLPRLFAKPFAERLLRPSLFLQTVLEPFLAPVAVPISALQNRVNRSLKWDGRLSFLNEEERQRMEQQSGDETEGQLEAVEREMIRAVLDFGDTMVREIMTPRLQIVSVPVESSRAQVLELARESRCSRIPVHSESLDRIVGILRVSDLLHVEDSPAFDLSLLVHPPYFVPETKRLNDLMREFRERALHMVVVVDEHGSVAGVATLEDVLEEIVGEIRDETDDEEHTLVRMREDGSWEVDGSLRVDDFEEEIGREFGRLAVPEGAEVDTVAGVFMLVYGGVPEAGVRIPSGAWELEVLLMDGNRIAQLLLRPRDPDSDA
jgi:CBS domain containing-hemolysin-like protein